MDHEKGPMVGTWTMIRTSKKSKNAAQPQIRGLMNLNSKVSSSLNPEEICTWLREQKVGLFLALILNCVQDWLKVSYSVWNAGLRVISV